ncbi:hypothetical protein [Brassicibacter mesophilus]|uniref:hypothetical protein n=1 Tax=Brassicibacter mesophilus TaxID=745119 RepID=UPI003D2492F4
MQRKTFRKKSFVFILLLSLIFTSLPQMGMASSFEEINEVDKEAVRTPDNNLFEKVSPGSILEDDSSVEIQMLPIIIGAFKYEITTSDEGQYYFPSQPFETITNKTSETMDISDTFSKKAYVKLSGSIACESEGKATIKSEFGFDYDYENTFSRKVSLKLKSGKSLKLFVEYQKIIITEKEYILDPSAPGNYRYNKTRRKTVYKPTGVVYEEV